MGHMKCSQCGRLVAGTIVSLCPACGGDLEVAGGDEPSTPPASEADLAPPEAGEPLEVTSRSGRMALEVDDRPVVVGPAASAARPEPAPSTRFPKPPLPPSLAEPELAGFPEPGGGRGTPTPRPTSPPLELDGPPLPAPTEAPSPASPAPPPPVTHEPPPLPEAGTSLQPDELTLAEMPDWADSGGVMIPTLPGEADGPPLELEDEPAGEAAAEAEAEEEAEEEIVGFTPEPGALPAPVAPERTYPPLAPGEDQVLLKRAAAASAAAALRPQEPLDGAVEACRHVLHWNPGSLRALVLLADLLERQGDLNGAAEACRRFLTLQPGNQRMANKLGGLEEALELQRRAAPPAYSYAPPAAPAPHPTEPPYPGSASTSWQADGTAPSAQPSFAPPPPMPVAGGVEWTAPSERDGGGAPYSVWAIVAFASVFLCSVFCPLVPVALAAVALIDTSRKGTRGRGLALAALICGVFLTIATILLVGVWLREFQKRVIDPTHEQLQELTDPDVYDPNELFEGPQGLPGTGGQQMPGGLRGPAMQPPQSMPGMSYQGYQGGRLGLNRAGRRTGAPLAGP